MHQLGNEARRAQSADLSAGAATSWTSVTVAAPTTATKVIVGAFIRNSSGANASSVLSIASDSAGLGVQYVGGGAGDGEDEYGDAEILLSESQTIYYQNSAASRESTIWTVGWSF